MKFAKPPLSIPAQVERLRSRGLLVPDQARAEHYLRFIGYYRLSAYALPLQHHDVLPDKPFKAGAAFEDILNLYRFDRELRLLAMDAVERIEVAARSVIVNAMSTRHGAHWFMDGGHFAPALRHGGLLDRLERDLHIPAGATTKTPAKDHNEDFVRHYYATYTDPHLPPAWMVGELLTLGAWSQMFEHLRVAAERKAIAAPFRVDEQVLRSWLHALTHLRNLCAHHARVWNRKFAIKPVIAKKHAGFLKANDRFYALAVAINELLQRIAPGTGWHARLGRLLEDHPFVDPAAMGFPADWRQEPFWSLAPPDYSI